MPQTLSLSQVKSKFPKDRHIYILCEKRVYEASVSGWTYSMGKPGVHVIANRIGSPDQTVILPPSDCFLSEAEAASECLRRYETPAEKRLRKYKAEIQTLNDLIWFPLKRDVLHNDVAKEAYLQRAKELVI